MVTGPYEIPATCLVVLYSIVVPFSMVIQLKLECPSGSKVTGPFEIPATCLVSYLFGTWTGITSFCYTGLVSYLFRF